MSASKAEMNDLIILTPYNQKEFNKQNTNNLLNFIIESIEELENVLLMCDKFGEHENIQISFSPPLKLCHEKFLTHLIILVNQLTLKGIHTIFITIYIHLSLLTDFTYNIINKNEWELYNVNTQMIYLEKNKNLEKTQFFNNSISIPFENIKTSGYLSNGVTNLIRSGTSIFHDITFNDLDKWFDIVQNNTVSQEIMLIGKVKMNMFLYFLNKLQKYKNKNIEKISFDKLLYTTDIEKFFIDLNQQWTLHIPETIVICIKKLNNEETGYKFENNEEKDDKFKNNENSILFGKSRGKYKYKSKRIAKLRIKSKLRRIKSKLRRK